MATISSSSVRSSSPFVPVATLASGFLRSRGDERAFPALVAASLALWVLLTTSMGEGGLGQGLPLPYLLTSAIGGMLRFLPPPSGTEPSCIGNLLLGFAIGAAVPLTVLGRAGLFTQAPNTGVTAVLVFMTGVLFYQACSGRSRLRLKQPSMPTASYAFRSPRRWASQLSWPTFSR